MRRRLGRGTQPGRARAAGKRFSKENQPKRGRGRPRGAQNYFTRDVKEALIDALNEFGRDGKGKDGLKGFLMRMCELKPELIMATVRWITPMHVKVERADPPKRYKTLDEVQAELLQYGLDELPKIPFYKGPVIALDGDDVTANEDSQSAKHGDE
jgi:hypothetical protein